eukprot:s207_g6.t1
MVCDKQLLEMLASGTCLTRQVLEARGSPPAGSDEDEEDLSDEAGADDAAEGMFAEALPFWPEPQQSPSASLHSQQRQAATPPGHSSLCSNGFYRSVAKVLCLHVVLIVGVLAYELGILVLSFSRYKPALQDPSQTMRAAQFAKPGPPAVIQVAQIPRPMCCETTQVLIKVGTGSLNPVDFKQRRNAMLEYMRPLPAVSGFDFSGKVEQVGAGVLGFRPGDTVYGMLPLQGQSWGAFQEYVVTNYTIIAHVPSKISPKEAAGLPLVGLTVVQALAPVLRTWQRNGESSKGKKILIHAGAGGVGSFAIQYCKNVLGMHVATTASATKEELVKSLGADQVINYRTTKFEDVLTAFDAVLDPVTQEYEARTLSSQVLKPGLGHYVNILSSDWEPNDGELGPLMEVGQQFAGRLPGTETEPCLGLYYHCDPVSPDASGLRSIASWVDAGSIKPVVDRSFPLEEVAQAHEYLEKGRAPTRSPSPDSRSVASRSSPPPGSPSSNSPRRSCSVTPAEVSVRPRKKGDHVQFNASHSDYEVVAQAAEERGWRVVKCEEKATMCNIHWIDDANIGDWMRKVEPWMRINHFPGMNNALARKTRLARNMTRMQRLFPAAYRFVPPTWVIPDDLTDLEKRFGNSQESKVFYIVKPDHLCQGRGIFLTTELDRLRQAAEESRKKNEATVVQRYLSRPMLIEGLKFDLRLYFLVSAKKASGEAGLDLRCFLFRDGLVRLCTTPYQPPTAETMNEKCMHLTNYAVNKNSSNFQQNDGEDDGAGSKRSLRWFMSYIGETYGEKERRKLWLKLMGETERQHGHASTSEATLASLTSKPCDKAPFAGHELPSKRGQNSRAVLPRIHQVISGRAAFGDIHGWRSFEGAGSCCDRSMRRYSRAGADQTKLHESLLVDATHDGKRTSSRGDIFWFSVLSAGRRGPSPPAHGVCRTHQKHHSHLSGLPTLSRRSRSHVSVVSSVPSVLAPMPPVRSLNSVPETQGLLENHYVTTKELGKGSYGVVYCVRHRRTGLLRALKSIPFDKLEDTAQLNHPYIVKLYEVFQTGERVHLVMELCGGGSLAEMLASANDAAVKAAGRGYRAKLPVEKTGRVRWQMLAGIAYLHHHRIIHRDIKPENYLVQHRGEHTTLKLADFGLACSFKKGRPLKDILGTPCYVAPEVLNARYDERCDVWSVGVVSFVLCTGHHPFAYGKGDKAKVVLERIRSNHMDPAEAHWDESRKEAKELVFQMLTRDPAVGRDPEQRPSAKKLLAKSLWLQQFDVPERPEEPAANKGCCVVSVCMKTVLMVKPTLETEYDGAFPRDLTGGQMGCRCFELLGIDVMLDAKMKPYLIEVNHLPSFTCDSPLDEDIKRRLVSQTLDLTCGSLSGKDRKLYEQLVRERREAGQPGNATPCPEAKSEVWRCARDSAHSRSHSYPRLTLLSLCGLLAAIAGRADVFCQPRQPRDSARGVHLARCADPEHHDMTSLHFADARQSGEVGGSSSASQAVQAPGRNYNFEEYRGVYRRLISDETWPQVLRIVVVGPIGDEFRQTVEEATPKVLGWDPLSVIVSERTRWQSLKLDVRFTNPDDFCALHRSLAAH